MNEISLVWGGGGVIKIDHSCSSNGDFLRTCNLEKKDKRKLLNE